MPWLDRMLRHNPALMWLERRGLYGGTTFPGATFAMQRFGQREQQQKMDKDNDGRLEDMLDKFRRAKQEKPEHITNIEVLGLSLSTMIAGSEPRSVILPLVFSD